MSDRTGDRQVLAAWLDELDERNTDNVTRTESYLELYAWTVAGGRELPWVLMAHLVSRNAGYLMSDLARSLDGKAGADPALAGAMKSLMTLLERANFLIFHDAWHHVLHHLLGRTDELSSPRTPRFMIDAWGRHGRNGCADERPLVLDLVHNEQHLIERRAVHHARLAPGLRLLEMIEMSGREKPLHFPIEAAPAITVGGFAQVDRRIAAGARIFDEVVADRSRRSALLGWARTHPHTGTRAVYGGKPGPTIRAAWPVSRLRTMWNDIHAPMEPDPLYP
jgi:Protein of unknown function (DUF2515)